MQDLYLLPFATNSKSIIMEDDVVVQKSFLKFMNIALNVYEKSDDIFCICGRLGPENHSEKSNDAQAFQIQNILLLSSSSQTRLFASLFTTTNADAQDSLDDA